MSKFFRFIYNSWRFRKSLSITKPNGMFGILMILKEHLSHLHQLMGDSEETPKEVRENVKRTILLLNQFEKGDYLERCGFKYESVHNSKGQLVKVEQHNKNLKALSLSLILENKEINELSYRLRYFRDWFVLN
ncbi:MAG: hypothetical protein H8E84_05020 [Flavobacteriales bacterium]|nr:hypothetical protein [Flavobacteriales bacterium]